MWTDAEPDTPHKPVPSNPGPGDVPPVNPSPEEPNPADPKPYPTDPIPQQPEIRAPRGRPRSARAVGAARAGLFLLAALALPACGDSKSREMPSSISSTGERATIQKASAPVMAVELSSQAAADAVVENGAPGAISSPFPALARFGFSGSIQQTVDLGVSGPGGVPRYPGASGHLSVLASGVAAGGGLRGSVLYSVGVTATSDLRFIDADSGDVATIAPGGRWTLSLRVDWTFTDPDNWSLVAQSNASIGPLSSTVVHQSEVVPVEVTGTRQRTVRVEKILGALRRTGTIQADWTADWTDSTGSHRVTFHVDGEDAVTVVRDGTTEGPFTRGELRTRFGLRWE